MNSPRQLSSLVFAIAISMAGLLSPMLPATVMAQILTNTPGVASGQLIIATAVVLPTGGSLAPGVLAAAPSPSITPQPTSTLQPSRTPTLGRTITATTSPTSTPTPNPSASSQGGLVSILTAVAFALILLAVSLAALQFSGRSVPGLFSSLRKWVRGIRKGEKPEAPLTTTTMLQIAQLGEQFSREFFLERREFALLIEYVKKVQSGNIALAGSRGIGKTALMQGLLSDPGIKKYISLGVSTPTRYDERDFVLNLFEGLCLAVRDRVFSDAGIDVQRMRGKQLYRAPEFSRAERAKPIMLIFSIVVLFLVVQQASLIRDLFTSIGGLTVVGYLVAAGIGAFVLVAVVILLWFAIGSFRRTTVEHIERSSPQLAEIYMQTERRLERIGFLQAYQRSASSEMSLGNVLKMGGSLSQSLMRQPYTLVGLIADYRDYMEMVIKQYGKAVVCLDELDKVLDPQEARLFLRKIKGVFSLNHVYYIVSVSEEALEAFKLRGLRGKDEVDSTFGTVIVLDRLTDR